MVEKIGRIVFPPDEPKLTQQSAKDECDINMIVERAKRGADISHLSVGKRPMYGDFTGLPDYREALIMVNKAQEMFMGLDARVRERFANDPARLLDFLDNPDNRDEAVKLGLVNPPPVEDDVVEDKPDTGLDPKTSTAPPPPAPKGKGIGAK